MSSSSSRSSARLMGSHTPSDAKHAPHSSKSSAVAIPAAKAVPAAAAAATAVDEEKPILLFDARVCWKRVDIRQLRCLPYRAAMSEFPVCIRYRPRASTSPPTSSLPVPVATPATSGSDGPSNLAVAVGAGGAQPAAAAAAAVAAVKWVSTTVWVHGPDVFLGRFVMDDLIKGAITAALDDCPHYELEITPGEDATVNDVPVRHVCVWIETDAPKTHSTQTYSCMMMTVIEENAGWVRVCINRNDFPRAAIMAFGTIADIVSEMRGYDDRGSDGGSNSIDIGSDSRTPSPSPPPVAEPRRHRRHHQRSADVTDTTASGTQNDPLTKRGTSDSKGLDVKGVDSKSKSSSASLSPNTMTAVGAAIASTAAAPGGTVTAASSSSSVPSGPVASAAPESLVAPSKSSSESKRHRHRSSKK